MPEKIAILCSDLHLSHMPPLARNGEPDWYEAMARPLRELRDLAEGVPVLCGGDVFDRWNSPPKLITFAMRCLPVHFHSVMGQHDLPYHSWEQRESSAFWTLVESGSANLAASWKSSGRVTWRGFQWGEVIKPMDRKMGDLLTVCIAHQYVWVPGRGYPEVSTEQNELVQFLGQLRGYGVVLLGDNHKGFVQKQGRKTVFNAGTFMRRHADEWEYRPMVGILREDGTVEPHHLDTSRDVFDSSSVTREAEQVLLNLDSFLEGLEKLGETGLDFRRCVTAAMDREQVSKGVRRAILAAMEAE